MTDSPQARPFWETKSLSEMTAHEWESLCDGCGKCCLIRLEDDESGDFYTTDVHCKLFDNDLCHVAQRSRILAQNR